MFKNMTLQQKLAFMVAMLVIFGVVVGMFGYTSLNRLWRMSVDEYQKSLDYIESSPEKMTPETYGDLSLSFREKMKAIVSRSLVALLMVMGIGILMSVIMAVVVLKTVTTAEQSRGIGPDMSNNEIASTLETLAGIIRYRP